MEDFVTFEIAKKLKDKGFKYKCLAYYDVLDNVGILFNTQYTDDILPCQYTDLLLSHNEKEVSYPDDSECCVDAPTISQVLKWLRYDNISVEPCATYNNMWWYVIKINGKIEVTYIGDGYNSYEESALAGINYVLDNLI